MKHNLISHIIQRAKRADMVVIVGAKKTGKDVLHYLEQEDIKVSLFFDNNSDLYSQRVEGIPVISPKNQIVTAVYILLPVSVIILN